MDGKQANASAPCLGYIVASKGFGVRNGIWPSRVHESRRPALGCLNPKAEAAAQ